MPHIFVCAAISTNDQKALPHFYILFFYAPYALPQEALVKNGNIFFLNAAGVMVQLTSGRLDSDPSLSQDSSQVVFVRRTPSYKIETGAGTADENEPWSVHTDGTRSPQLILRGRPGGYDPQKNIVLAGFATPRFSADGRGIYYVAATWATGGAIHLLNTTTGQTRFICAGNCVEVIYSGRYRGDLIVRRSLLPEGGGRYEEYWLMDAEGRPLVAI